MSPPKPSECLSENAVLAYVRAATSAADAAAIEAHLDECEPCRQVVAAAARFAEDSAATRPGARTEPGALAARPLGPPRRVAAGLPAPPLAPGSHIARYVIMRTVGEGGMGEVYEAWDPQLRRKVAIKLLARADERDAQELRLRERFLREAQLMARLSHPNVVTVHDAGWHEGQVFIAMELVEGETLARWLAAEPRDWRAVRAVFRQAGEGLAAAHQLGVVHRDFKPANVLLGTDGRVRVTDFGLARTTEQSSDTQLRSAGRLAASPPSDEEQLTRTGALLGTPAFMAPEQFLAQATDPRTDEFAFCVALYRALYRQAPFAGLSPEELAQSVGAGQLAPPPPSAAPRDLERIVRRGLSVDPNRRYPSLRELLAELAAIDQAPARRSPRRAWLIAGALAVALVGLGVTLGARWLRRPPGVPAGSPAAVRGPPPGAATEPAAPARGPRAGDAPPARAAVAPPVASAATLPTGAARPTLPTRAARPTEAERPPRQRSRAGGRAGKAALPKEDLLAPFTQRPRGGRRSE
jgi:tRNA A-37 threonylcarbamoyl transferase component Bud32